MSLQFLSQKSWHPANKTNQKRIWVAEQKAREQEQCEKENTKKVREAADALRTQQVDAAAGNVGQISSQQVDFLYAVPPGLPKDRKATQPMKIEEDDAVREFRRRAERRGEPQRKLERYVGKRAEETLTIKDQVERFPMLKDAPVEGKYTQDIRVHFNPLGLRLRNVRCIRCSEWGHQSGDRECKLRNLNPNDATRQKWEDPMTEVNRLKSVKQELVLRRGALPVEMHDVAIGQVFEILHSDDDENEDAVSARSLPKKRLTKKKKKSKKYKNHEHRFTQRSRDRDTTQRRDASSSRRAENQKHSTSRRSRSRSRLL